jgi:dedicator of cytokinesis protein 3
MQTTDTSILDTPSRPARQERSRLSFLQRNKHDQASVPVMTNGHPRHEDTSSTRSQGKENRRSFFSGPRPTGSESGDGGDGDWVTDSGFEGTPEKQGAQQGAMRRSGSTGQRSDPAIAMGGRVGSVRKRLSMLKLGKKNSKASVLVDSVAEE